MAGERVAKVQRCGGSRQLAGQLLLGTIKKHSNQGAVSYVVFCVEYTPRSKKYMAVFFSVLNIPWFSKRYMAVSPKHMGFQ